MTPNTFHIEIKNLSPAGGAVKGMEFYHNRSRTLASLIGDDMDGRERALRGVRLCNPLDQPAIQSARLRLITRLAEICTESRIYSDLFIEAWHTAITAHIFKRTVDGVDPDDIACEIHDITNLSLYDEKILLKTPSLIIAERETAGNV